MRRPCKGALFAVVAALLFIAACAAPRAVPPPPSPTPAPTRPPTATPTLRATATAATPVPGAGDVRALVDRFIDAWANGTIHDIMALFPDELEYQMGPNYITQKPALEWFTTYWNYDAGSLILTQCDPVIGSTVRCDLEYRSGCSPYLDLGAIDFDTKFTARHGKLVKVIATMSPEQFAELTTILQGMYAWAAENMPSEWARLQSALPNVDPITAARIELDACIGYAKAVRATREASGE